MTASRQKLIISLLFYALLSTPVQAVQILDCLDIEKLDKQTGNLELSGLAYEADSSILYAIGDDATLVRLAVRFSGDTLLAVKWLGKGNLLDAAGKPLQGVAADSEGLAAQWHDDGVLGNTVLWVSFERKVRVCRYHTDGSLIDCPALPPQLSKIANYSKPNSALESMAYKPGIGAVVAAERPLVGDSDGWHSIWALDGSWQRRVKASNMDAALTAIEFMPDGSLLALEREYSWWRFAARSTLLLYPTISPGGTAMVLLAQQAGSLPVGNFEGLTRRGPGHVFMVSDDNRLPLTASWLLYISLNNSGTNAGCR